MHPQVGYEEEEKEEFWEEMGQEIGAMPSGERVLVGADLDGHIGRDRDGVARVHGGWGVGEKNEGGERIMEFVTAFDLGIINFFSQNRRDSSLPIEVEAEVVKLTT